MNIGETIYRLRTERGMSQGALAEALDVSRQSVSKWENNSAVPELEKLVKMSEIFGVTLDQLVGREEQGTPGREYAGPEIIIREATPPHRTIGIILLCFGLLVTLLLSILGGFVVGVMLGLPFTIVGCVCIAGTEGILFKCVWAFSSVYVSLLYYFMLNFIGFGWGVRIGIMVIWFVILILISLRLHLKGKLSPDSKKLMVGCIIIALVLFGLLEIANRIMYQRTGLYSTTEEIPISSVTMGEP